MSPGGKEKVEKLSVAKCVKMAFLILYSLLVWG